MKYIQFSILMIFFIACSKEPGDLKSPNLQSVPVNPGDFTLTSLKDSVVADGFTYLEVLAKVDTKLLDTYKEVNFDIAPFGKFTNNSPSMKLTFDLNGEARAFIYSDIAGLTNVKATIGNLNRVKSIKFYKDNADTLKLLITRDNVPADNYSYAEITAITKKRPFANNQIVFVADRGTFTNNSSTYTIQASLNDTTKAYIKYSKSEPVRITATIYNTYSKEIYATFIPAWPGQIFVSPSVSTLPPLFTSMATITANLIRSTGTVTEGRIVHFYDSASVTGASIGTFLNTTLSNPSGIATSQYWLQDTSFHGFVYIKSYVDTDTGRVRGENRILIQ